VRAIDTGVEVKEVGERDLGTAAPAIFSTGGHYDRRRRAVAGTLERRTAASRRI